MSMTSVSKALYDFGISLPKLKNQAKAGTAVPTVALISTADATDATTTQSLTNIEKAKINELITALKTAGVIT